MKKSLRLAALAALAALVVVATCVTSMAATKGWAEEDGEWVWLDSNGEKVTSTFKLSGSNYYWLNDDGYLGSDELVEYEGNYYYVDKTGAMVKNQWKEVENDSGDDAFSDTDTLWYYFQSSGKAYKSGKKSINGSSYIFDDLGRRMYGWISKTDSGYTMASKDADSVAWKACDYYAGDADDGVVVTNAWRKISVYDGTSECEYWFYFRSNGKKYTMDDSDAAVGYTVKTIGTETYKFAADGHMVADDEESTPSESSAQTTYKKGWNTIDGKRYYLDENGSPLYKNQIRAINGERYLFDTDGALLEGLYYIKFTNAGAIESYVRLDAEDEDTTLLDKYTTLDKAGYDDSENDSKSGVYYFEGPVDTSGKMIMGSQTVEVDGDSYTFKFETSGTCKGKGINGRDGSYYYVNGRKLRADSDQKFVLYKCTIGADSKVSKLYGAPLAASAVASDAANNSSETYALISSTGTLVKSGTKKDGNDYKIWISTYKVTQIKNGDTVVWPSSIEAPIPEQPTNVLAAPSSGDEGPRVTGTYTYTGAEQTASVTGYDASSMDITGNVGTDAGDYIIELTPKDGEWSGVTDGALRLTWSIGKAAKDAPAGLSGVAPGDGDDMSGSITGTTAEMEYRAAGDSDYILCMSSTVEDLQAGTYYVRYAESDNYLASADTKVVVGKETSTDDSKADLDTDGADSAHGPGTASTDSSTSGGSDNDNNGNTDNNDNDDDDDDDDSYSTAKDTSSSNKSDASDKKTTTTTNSDGSTTSTTTKADGTKVEITKATDGSTTTTTTKADGSTGTVTTKTDASGATTVTAKANVSIQAVEAAKKENKPVTVPVEVAATSDIRTAPSVKVSVPAGAGKVDVEVPVTNVTDSTVAVLVKADGTEEIIPTTLPTADGVKVSLSGDCTIKIIDNAKTFADTREHWCKEEVNFVAARNLFKGVDEDNFDVSGSMTRAMVNTVLARLSGVDTEGGATWDAKGNEWAIANGISDGTDPAGDITREQLATMLYRYAGSPEVTGTLDFVDARGVSSYAEKAMIWATQVGIIGGMGDGTIAPTAGADRAEVAAMFARYIKVL